MNNLRLLDSAKQTWALEHHKSPDDTPTWADLKPYLTIGTMDAPYPNVSCPSGGTYTLGCMSNKPTCSIAGHALP